MTRLTISPRFLASVRSVEEALIAVRNGADIIDCKEPNKGALGALSTTTVAQIRDRVPSHIPVSATIGDDAMQAPDFAARLEQMASTDIDFIKIGFDGDMSLKSALDRITDVECGHCQLVGVLLADRSPDFGQVAVLAEAGFVGVLLDTADKHAGALPEVMTSAKLKKFITMTRAANVFAGLAGALRVQHVEDLLKLEPDILGFRGALCDQGERRGTLDAQAIQTIRSLIKNSDKVQPKHTLNLEGLAS